MTWNRQKEKQTMGDRDRHRQTDTEPQTDRQTERTHSFSI